MLGTGENRAHLPLMDAIAIDLAVMEPDGPDDAMGKEAGARFVPHTGEGRNVAIFRNPARKGAERHEIGRAHVLTPVTNAHLVCRLLLEKQNKHKSHTKRRQSN